MRRGSGQRDTTLSELFHALPKLGRWGTPTARAYPVEVKNAFLLAKHHAPPAGE